MDSGTASRQNPAAVDQIRPSALDRRMNGGYALARDARTISAYEVIFPSTDRSSSPRAAKASRAVS